MVMMLMLVVVLTVICRQVNIIDVQTVWLEKIATRPLRPYVTGDLVDKAISEFLQKCVCQPQVQIVRVDEGKYRIGDDSKILLLRILRSVCE